MHNSFIKLKNGFEEKNVKNLNRRRIALIGDKMNQLSANDQKKVVQYISKYCPDLDAAEDFIAIGSNRELKLLLYGLAERYYTTPIGEEKRIANSIIKIKDSR